MADEREEIRSRINIVDLVSRRVPLKRTGKNWTGLCPFHEDRNPSFFVSADTGRYKCWSCGESGDAFTWVMKTQNLTFVEALEQLAKEAGVTLRRRDPSEIGQRTLQIAAMDDALSFFRSALLSESVAKDYCANRGLSDAVLSHWEIGYSPDQGTALTVHLQKKGHSLKLCKELFLVDSDAGGGFYDKFRGRLMFPIRDERGDLVAFGGRIIGTGEPKYINSSDTPLYRKSRLLYGLNKARDAIAKTRNAVLVEGYLDVMACHAADVKQSVASLGTSLTDDHARLLKRWGESVTILYDADTAGEKAAARAVQVLQNAGLRVRVSLMPPGEDPDTLLRTAGPGAVQMAVESAMTPLDFRLRAIEARLTPTDTEYWSEAIEALAEAGTDLERESHLTRLAGLYPGMRDVVAARRALRGEVVKRKRSLRQVRTGQIDSAERPTVNLKAQSDPSERVILRGLMHEEVRPLAWKALVDDDVSITEACKGVVNELMGLFGLQAPRGPAIEWMGSLTPESAEILGDCDLDPEGLTAGTGALAKQVEGAAEKLLQKKKKRAVTELISTAGDDSRLREINDKLKALKTPLS